MKRSKAARIVVGIVAGLLAVLMLTSVFLGIFKASAVTQSEINALKDKLASATAKRKELQQQISQISADKAAVAAQIEALDSAMDAMLEEISIQEDLMQKINEQITRTTEELRLSEQQQKEQYDSLKERIRFMVENGNYSYLSILLSADSFSDFLSQYEIVSQIARYDREVYQKLTSIANNIRAQKEDLQRQKQDQQELLQELSENKKQLQTQIDQKLARMQELKNAEAAVKASFSDLEQQEEKLNEEITAAKKKYKEQQMTPKTYVGGKFKWPLPANYTYITSPFGMRVHPVTGIYKLHSGTDIRAPQGTKIYAANSGTVIVSAYNTAYGNYVVIDHGGGYTTLYAHMYKRAVSAGDKVTVGQTIGYVGSTGYATAAHLHFEIRINGAYQNPMNYFTLQ